MQEAERTSKIKKNVAIFGAILLTGFTSACFYYHFATTILHKIYPKNTFLFDPADAGNDFFNLLRYTASGDLYSWNFSVYFPFSYFLLWPFQWIDSRIAYLIYVFTFVLIAVHFLRTQIVTVFSDKWQTAFFSIFLIVLSYPFQYCLDRGNLEAFVFIFLVLFALNYEKERFLAAAVFLAMAAAIKGYPAVFGILFIRNRQYKEIALTIGVGAVLSVLAASTLPGGVLGTFRQISLNQMWFHDTQGMREVSIPFGTSFYSWIKIAWTYLSGSVPGNHVFKVYAALAAICSLILFYFSSKEIFRTWEALYLVLVPIIVFPQVSFDYKMISLLIPLGLAIGDRAFTSRYAWLFGLLFIPKSYFLLKVGTALPSISTILNPILICAIAVEILRRPLRTKNNMELRHSLFT